MIPRMYSLFVFSLMLQSFLLNISFSFVTINSRSAGTVRLTQTCSQFHRNTLWAVKGRSSGFSKNNNKKEGSSSTLSEERKTHFRSIDTNSHLLHVAKSIATGVDSIVDQLQSKSYAIVDDFLGSDISLLYRNEAEKMQSKMVPSQSTRWDEATNSVIAYDKHNVLSTQLLGGDMYYSAPRLHEYIVSMVQNIVPLLSKIFPEARLSPTLASNKLAVCLGDGSYYDKHYDNSGSDDLRKLTVLYYLNPTWTPDLGGYFRAFHPSPQDKEGDQHTSKFNIQTSEYEDIAPIADRLLVFWSDQLEHSVLSSVAPKGPIDHRYAMTIWIATTDAASIHI
jgi:SM-20-related protein